MKLTLANGSVLDLNRSSAFREFSAKPYSMTPIIVNQLNSGKFVVEKGDNALDIGANIGLFSLFISPIFKQITALEPTSEHIEIFEHMLKTFNINNVELVPKALWVHANGVKFNIGTSNSTMNSVVDCRQHSGHTNVESITLKDLIGNSKFDFMKMDIEGGELELFKDKKFLSELRHIKKSRIEVHDFPTLLVENIKKNIESMKRQILDEFDAVLTDVCVDEFTVEPK